MAFSTKLKIKKKLANASEVAVKDVLAVKENEKVLIITNPEEDVMQISMAIYDSCVSVKAKPVLIFQEVKTQMDFAEESIVRAIESNPDVVISISKEKLGKDKFRMQNPIVVGEKKYDNIFTYLLGEKKVRSFWSPSITAKMFAETVPVNYQKMRENCKKLADILTMADSVRITTQLGMDLTIGLKGRVCKVDDGDFTIAGRGGNLPAGEVFISPELNSSNGIIIFDGCIPSEKGVILIKNSITCKVENGFAKEISGGEEADKLKETLSNFETKTKEFVKEGKIPKESEESYLKNIRNLGEFGIGMNKKARIVGNILEDEKVYGTCHIALGSNYDEDAKALNHLDGIINSPTIVANVEGKEIVLLEGGKLRRNLLTA